MGEPLVDGLSIILPAYNEEENLCAAVTRSLGVLEKLARNYEVVIVDDGSSDGTATVAQELAAEHYPRVRVLRQPVNQGYGAALRTGFRRSRYDLVFFTDSDNQFDVSELQYFLPLADQFDIVTGFRVYRFDPVLRSMLSWIYNRIVGVLFRVRVRDVDCAFKLMRREVVSQITIESNNFFVCCELLAKARKWNFRIAEKGVRHFPRTAGESRVRASDIPRTLSTLVRMWQRIYFPTDKQMRRLLALRDSDDGAIEFVPTA
jgi:glycosyltransferase involved in cell wall biosynthesis